MAKFPDDYRPNHLCMPTNVRKTFQSRFFYPNMCHVCHCLESETIKLKRCNNCNMISYCSKEHQQEHWYLHKEFCRVVAMFLKFNGTNNLFGFMKSLKDPDERFNAKAMLLNMLRKQMNRDLYDFEKQMILYPRMCEICFETNPDLLVNCQFCPQASFCTIHSNNKSRHNEICFFYAICYTSDFYLFCDDSCRIIPSMNYVLFQEDENFIMPENMSIFLQEYITGIPLIWMDLTKFDYWIYVCSDFFSKPLTMLYALQQLNFKVKSTLTIHIIGLASSKEYEFLSMETILHLLTQLKALNIILISPSLIERIEETSQQVNVCNRCVEKKKCFSMTGYKMPYSSYVKSKSFKTPDIIICYDLGDLKCQLWDQSLMEMKEISAPFLVTNNTLPRALNYQKRMDDLFNYLTSDVHIQKNPFSSTWPYRNEIDNLLNLQNNYFSVYTLHNIDIDDQAKNKKMKQVQKNQSDENIHKEENETQKSSNEPNTREEFPSTSNSNQDVENCDSEQLKKKRKKKKKNKKINQSPDVSRPASSNNNYVAPEIPNETPSKIDESPPNEQTEIVDLTFQLSATSIQENKEDIVEAKTDQVKKKKSKKKKSKSVQESNVENKLEEAKVENKIEERDIKRKKKKKSKKQASTSKNIESDDADDSSLKIKIAHSDCVNEDSLLKMELLEANKAGSSTTEGNRSQYLFGPAPCEKTLEQLVEDNKRLFVNVEQIAEEYKMLKITGKQTATSMLQEMECLRMSLENIEEKIMTIFPGEFD